ncbi:MAG: TlpA family protein disulfide reductase [Nitrospinota bacterium]|nr:TlpA family protein disulfide reductase [Nitrospinota bacterium]
MIKRLLILSALVAAGYSFGTAAIGPDHVHAAQAAAQAATQTATQTAKPPENPPAPDFHLEDVMNGGKVRLSSYKGKWVFLNFWATWCGPCVVEMPMMNSLYNKMKKDGLAMVAVSIDEGDGSSGMVKKFAREFKLDFTILHDPDNSAMRDYRVRSIPRTFFVDPDGNIQAAAEGVREWDNPEMVKFFHGIMQEFANKKKEEAKNGPGKGISG